MSRIAQPTLQYYGHGRPFKPSLFQAPALSPNPIVEAAVRRFLSPDARPIFQRHWDEAKERLGLWKAGLTLRSFVEKNTQEIELDPWEQAANDGSNGSRMYMRSTGSNNPLSYDCMLVLCKIAPTTSSPTILHVESKTLISVGDDVVFFRKGRWFYAASPPIPAYGRQLEHWEYVKCWTARFTLPFADPEELVSEAAHQGAVEIDMQVL
ncbi:hypothetical protein BDW22DRAFT_1420795 [Trametopsis cervina]|nr:hypothetical protein BDW22DRAFT_1420795 [Trametopsis cervina]